MVKFILPISSKMVKIAKIAVNKQALVNVGTWQDHRQNECSVGNRRNLKASPQPLTPATHVLSNCLSFVLFSLLGIGVVAL